MSFIKREWYFRIHQNSLTQFFQLQKSPIEHVLVFKKDVKHQTKYYVTINKKIK
jgi:hypothetical protein